MALTDPCSRKRYRNNFDDEISEFTPLSKRINNLHINNVILPAPKHLEHLDSGGEMHKTVVESDTRSSFEGARSVDTSPDPWTTAVNSYSPDLNPSENPYYYESNRLLFELYMERVHRCSGLSNTHYA